MPTTNVGRIKLFYDRAGSGPPLVFVAGLGADHNFFAPLVGELRGRYDCVTFDNRGIGESSRPRHGYAVSDLVKDTIGLLDSLSIARTHLLGWSMGGMVAQAIALEHPERVAGLVLAGSMAAADARLMHVLNSRKTMQRRMRKEEYFSALAAWMFGPRKIAEPGFVAGYARRAAENPHPQALTAFDQLVDGIGAFDSRPMLGKIGMPTLVMVGEDDILTPPHLSRELAEGISGSEFVLLPGVGHFCGTEDPKGIAATIAGFLARVDA